MRFHGFGLVDSPLEREAEAIRYAVYSDCAQGIEFHGTPSPKDPAFYDVLKGTGATCDQRGNAAKAKYIERAMNIMNGATPGYTPPPPDSGNRVVTQQFINMGAPSNLQPVKTGNRTDGKQSPLRQLQIALALTQSVLQKKISDRANMRAGSAAANLLDTEIAALQAEIRSLQAQIAAAQAAENQSAGNATPVVLGTATGAPATNSNTPSTGSSPGSVTTIAPTSGSTGGGGAPNSLTDSARAEQERRAAEAAAWRAKEEARQAAQAVADAQAAAEAEAAAKLAEAKSAAEAAAAQAELDRIKSESIAPSGGGLGWLIGGLLVKWIFF